LPRIARSSQTGSYIRPSNLEGHPIFENKTIEVVRSSGNWNKNQRQETEAIVIIINGGKQRQQLDSAARSNISN
jgi:hypothetical protein